MTSTLTVCYATHELDDPTPSKSTCAVERALHFINTCETKDVMLWVRDDNGYSWSRPVPKRHGKTYAFYRNYQWLERPDGTKVTHTEFDELYSILPGAIT